MRSRKEKSNADAGRTSAHNSLIVKFNLLARYLKSCDRDYTWRDILGDEKQDLFIRKRIGDMAAYLCLFTALKNR